MALEAQIKESATREGASLVGIAPVETYADYCTEVERRLVETGATRYHASQKHLGGLERLPRLLDLLSGDYPQIIIQRNAAIALASIGTGRKEAAKVPKNQVEDVSQESQ
jgi:hypothetical protein